MSPDDRVDLIKRISEERRERILPALAQAERENIRRLAAYPEGTAGAVMTSEYAVLPPGLTTAEAIDKLRSEAPDKETIYYGIFPVVDQPGGRCRPMAAGGNRPLIGALLPLAAVRLNLDPAVVASPALTTLVDITGLQIIFSTAKWLVGI